MEAIEYKRNHRFKNWAGTFVCTAERYYQPHTLDELKSILGDARAHKKQLRTVGCGHSPSDIAMTTDWMVNLDHLNNVIEVNHEKHEVTVEAGMRLFRLHEILDKEGWAMPNIGSISDQSVAGAIATATHGSSLKHKLISDQVRQLTILLADGTERTCSEDSDPELFKAACVSLGALGIIIRIKMHVVPAFDLGMTSTVMDFDEVIDLWKAEKLWNSAEYVRVWWFPYSSRCIVARQDRIQPNSTPRTATSVWSWLADSFWGYHAQQIFHYIGRIFPSWLPAFERFVFSRRYGWALGSESHRVDNSYDGMNMDCLYAQYVDEWSLPIPTGADATIRLRNWLINHDTSPTAGIPDHDPRGIFIHAPIEIRVTRGDDDDAYLSTAYGHDTVYIGVIMYRPYHLPTSYHRYFSAYESLIHSLGGRPHWAKQHGMGRKELEDKYPELGKWLSVRERVDPEGVFLGEYVRRHLVEEKDVRGVSVAHGEVGRRYKAVNWVGDE
ncbi:D-arabinono-1,4-lactone oxidase [Saitoella coloradoensis]